MAFPYNISERVQMEKVGRIELYETIAGLAELRDNESGAHNRWVGVMAKLLAKAFGCPAQFCEDMKVFAPLHDIGKIGIPDSILLAPRKLTEEELVVMNRHTTLGYDIVKDKKEMKILAEITRCHHERYNGTGYPDGLNGEKIPLSARITALADVFDALRSVRPYKKSWQHAVSVEEVKALAGGHLDPALVDCFVQNNESFIELY